MAETYRAQPNNPVDFLAKWLINYNLGSVTEDRIKDRETHAELKQKEHVKECKEVEMAQEQLKKIAEQKEKTIEAFYSKFKASDDLEDHLQGLSDLLWVSNTVSNKYRKLQMQPLATLES
jgi:hypothetical protein